jgi:hypothetical protein
VYGGYAQPKLDNYKKCLDTGSCYLDGFYFNKIFANYPGLIREPLRVSLRSNDGEIKFKAEMKNAAIDLDTIGIQRVIIDMPKSKHSNLLIIDFQSSTAFRFDPLGHHKYDGFINAALMQYLALYMPQISLHTISNPAYTETNDKCTHSGFCMAYVTKYAYDYINDREFDPTEIKKWVRCVEELYGPLPPTQTPDVEYGLFDSSSGQGALIGGLGGAVVGGAVGGGSGALLGGLLGGGAGYLMGSSSKK